MVEASHQASADITCHNVFKRKGLRPQPTQRIPRATGPSTPSSQREGALRHILRIHLNPCRPPIIDIYRDIIHNIGIIQLRVTYQGRHPFDPCRSPARARRRGGPAPPLRGIMLFIIYNI